jgi:hypothetical protein
LARSPLFDIYDPYGELEERARLGMLDDEDYLLAGPVGIRKPTLSDLMPEEEKKGWLNSLAEMGSSGLATAGYLLDTPGAIVRGVLAGDPLSAFGSSEDRVTGRELLRQYGAIGEDDNWGNFSGGVLAETLLDPLTYGTLGLSMLGRGAASQAGKALKATGLLRDSAIDSATRLNDLRALDNLAPYADDIPTPRVREYQRRLTPERALQALDPAERAAAQQTLLEQFERFGVDPVAGMQQRVGVLDNFRIPGTNIGFEVGGGAFGDAIAEGLDRFGNFTKVAPVLGPVTRTAAALFDQNVGGLGTLSSNMELTNELQFNKRAAKAAARNNREAVDRAYSLLQYDARNADVPDTLPGTYLPGGSVPIPEELRTFDSQTLWDRLADYVESRPLQGPTLPGSGPLKTTGDDVADWVLENVPEFRAVRDRFANLGPEAIAAAREAGLATPVAQSRGVDGFIPRQLRRFLDPSAPDIPGGEPYDFRSWGRDERAFSVQDNFGRSRDPAYDLPGGIRAFRYLTGNVDPLLDSRALQQSLINAPSAGDRRRLLRDALRTLGGIDNQAFTFAGETDPYRYLLEQVQSSQAYRNASPADRLAMLRPAQREANANYEKLGQLLMKADTQFADQGIGIFDTPSWNNALRYERGQAENIANADQLFGMLRRRVDPTPAGRVVGGQSVSLADAARELGFDPQNFANRWMQNAPVAQRVPLDQLSIPRQYVDAMKVLTPQSRLALPERGIMNALDQFTSAFKIGALASPAFHVRNQYSGMYNAATEGALNPVDMIAAARASGGNAEALVGRITGGRSRYRRPIEQLRASQAYQNAPPATQQAMLRDAEQEALRQFMADSGGQRLPSSNVISDISGVEDPGQIPGMYVGSGPTIAESTRQALQQGRRADPANRTWGNFLGDLLSFRGVGITREPRPYQTNPLLAFNDAVGSRTEDTLRIGTFLTLIRQGVDQAEAGDTVRRLLVDYSPSAFTDFERNVMKRVAPFYSFQKGILPSIAENTLYRPGGLQGQTIRAVTRGTEPSEDNFIPEYLRQSAAIPLPEGWPSLLGGEPAEGLKRYITNIDLPFESTLNLFTPGVGATAAARIADTIQKTGSNILGQTNPLIKAPLEYITNRQLYTGRDMSDLYSVLEQDLGPIGRPLEQAIINFVPFGARGISMYRQFNDDRLDPVDARLKAAFNVLAGVKLTDVDEERTKRQAARGMLNQILETTPGVRTYENLTVPDDALRAMPEDQRQMYLLYRILQSDAAKRARERKKTALDPLEVLGAVR